MGDDSCTFIVVPDATSQCKRYSLSKKWLCIAGVVGIALLIFVGVMVHMMGSEYLKMSMKVEELEKLKKISVSQKSTIDRYEEDITQLSKHLAQIQQLNSRLMVLTGMDPTKEEHGLGLGGSEELDAVVEVDQNTSSESE
ncbi:hypothetical protein GF339_04435 [candidate division KSB3 bacterium]|uniref:Uncharacterized protein n=1 Tax=candidate division KSB3 bacterium TaxID=2044937 RepID=A0A9D5Q5D8_9BACT|nr:hypothetical protein [candidate division KSB3 bacterium]